VGKEGIDILVPALSEVGSMTKVWRLDINPAGYLRRTSFVGRGLEKYDQGRDEPWFISANLCAGCTQLLFNEVYYILS
jgi:hypothetical protein